MSEEVVIVEKREKSWKREVALALLIWLGYLVETKDVELIEILVFPIFTYSAIAFGLQWYNPYGMRDSR
jgi:hypothetical protein